MKKFIVILGVLAVLGVAGVAFIFHLTSGLTESASAFFDAVKAKNYTSAYALVSDGFKAATSQEQFNSFLQSNGLTETASTSWNNRSVTTDGGKLEGSITTKSGTTIPLGMTFVKENDTWKINSIDKAASGVTETNSSSAEVTVPSLPESTALVQKTIKVFAESVNKKDFTPFYKEIASLWQKQTTPEKLTEIFKTFVDKGVDMSSLEVMTPTLDTAGKLDGRVLIIKGSYATKPSSVGFELKYVKEGQDWKAVGTNIDISTAPSNGGAPKTEEADSEDETSEE